MLGASRLCAVVLASALAGCATAPETVVAPAPAPATAPPPPPAAQVKPPVDEKARIEEARALLAQAETDVQRARSRKALWLRAWESLLAAREAVGRSDADNAIRLARTASELAQLGLEQLAYPAVK